MFAGIYLNLSLVFFYNYFWTGLFANQSEFFRVITGSYVFGHLFLNTVFPCGGITSGLCSMAFCNLISYHFLS